MANETITFEYGGSSCSRFSSSEIYQGRDHYTFPISKQRFSLNLFYNSGSDQTSTDLELHKIEPIFTDTAFQDGRSPSVERYHRERRLYVQGRSQRRICSSTSSQSFTKIFDIREQQYCLPIHLSSLRSEHCTSSFFKIDEICGRAFTGEGYAPCLLSRRYLCIGEIEKQDARISTDTNSTSRESGLPHPQGEECARAEKDPGISRVSIQHSNNVNLSSNPQSNQVTTANQTSRGTSHTIMPMDSESVREDDSRHPSNRGSSVTYPTHATRFIQKLEDTQSQLGQELQTISPIDGGDHMVEKIFSKEKRSTNSQTTNSRTICQDLCRCVRCGLGSDFPVDSNCRILDTSRKRTIDQREGIENDLLRPSHTLKKTKTHHNQDFERQYDSLKICNEGRRNSIVCTSRSGSEDTRFMQPTSLNSTVPTHTGNPQCDSRPTESIQETVIRIDDSQENVPVYLQKMEESNEGRCFRRSSQPPTTELLEFPGGSICDQDRRLPPRLEEERTVHVSTMETDSEGSAENESGQDERGYLGDSIMEESILVPHNFTNETSGSTRSMECEQPMEVNRLEVISHKRKNNGLNQDTIKHLSKTTRSSTSKAYNSYWRKYAVWCRTRNYDPKIYNIQQIVTFLVDNRDKSYSTLNGYRSAVASVLTVLHPNSKPIAESRDIVDFFKAKRRGDVQIKKITQLETWDVDTLIQYIRLNLSPSASLNLYDLQQKVMILLCIHTMWRPRSDIGSLQYRDTDILRNQVSGETEGVLLQIREPKESQQKHIKLGFLEGEEQEEVCVVKTLLLFIQKTQDIREGLPIDHTLLLTSLNQSDPTKISSIRQSTVASWLSTHMQAAGIDPTYKPHSIRSASSTKAVVKGMSKKKVKEHAHWSLDADTFEKRYLKPPMKLHNSTKVQNSIFTTEKSTTSDSEAEATRIVLGTTYNSQVAEAKDEEVVRTQPWYRKFF